MDAEKLYNYLLANHYGRENSIVRSELAVRLSISERELRRLTKEINESPKFEKLVSTTHSCYICKTKGECKHSIMNTWRVAIALITKAKQMEKKVGLNGQIKISTGELYKDIVETFEE